MQYKILTVSITILILTGMLSGSAAAGWLIYHKPAFRGKVIDAETKEPIEGAVVVAIYNAHPIISGPAGGSAYIIKIKETLTDEKGEFYFPSYTTFIQPLAREDLAEFIIYKPGYWTFPHHQKVPSGIKPKDHEIFFSKEMGSKGELEMWIKEEKGPALRRFIVVFGIVELPKLERREEIVKRMMGIPSDFGDKDLPLLYNAINEERKRFGLGEVK